MSKKVTVVGVGALGSHVLQFVRNLDVQFWAIDFDRAEQKNFMSQFLPKSSSGKNKAVAHSQLMQFLWGTVVKVFPHKLVEENVGELLDYDPDNLIVDCLDNGASRRILQAHVRKHNLTCVHGALAADGMYGRVVWDKDFQIDDEGSAGEATCDGGEHLPFIGTVACLLAVSINTWVKTSKHVGYLISPRNITTI